MPLPFEAETLEIARARFRRALAEPWAYLGRPATEADDRPGLYRRHVFDFHDGMRLIVNATRLPDGNVVGELSVSVNSPDCKLGRKLSRAGDRVLLMAALALETRDRLGLLAPGCDYRPVMEYDTERPNCMRGRFLMESPARGPEGVTGA